MTEPLPAPGGRAPQDFGPPGAPITEAMIHDLVHAFYGKIRRDPALGPIFNRVIAETDWPAHLSKMCDFWSAVTLRTGRFRGAPMQAHIRVGGIRPTHFARWLYLFHETAREICPPAAAAVFIERSQMIARNLQMGIQMANGELAAAVAS